MRIEWFKFRVIGQSFYARKFWTLRGAHRFVKELVGFGMKAKIQPLSSALGAEVTDLDICEIARGSDLAAVQEAFLEYHLLCFRLPPLSRSQFFNLASLFGVPQLQLIRRERDVDVPEVAIFVSTYENPQEKPNDLGSVRLSGWHTDDSYFQIPAKATLLQALDIPESGGETRFCNTQAAYEDLSMEMKHKLDGKQAVHKYDTKRAVASPKKLSNIENSETLDVVHPLVRTHDDTHAKAIYYNSNRTDSVVGISSEESNALLDELGAHITQNKYRYDHEWRVGDVLLWDNRSLVHSVNVDFPVGQTRRHQRILLKGCRPV